MKDRIQYLNLSLRLMMSAHHPEGHQRTSCAGCEGRNNGMKRLLAGPHLVGMAWLKHEARAAVLHGYACAGYHHTRSKIVVMRLDHGDHHPIRIGCRKIHRAAIAGQLDIWGVR